ncbi:hypothetical protein FGO68_gene17568 [Halteria grandinella]|uniref:Ecp2 effector protein domain-containing protein n=1 Tax=Halteria grandinella TaxID=5974 RepID=A0A8J8SYY1_HALGN|nr:hypothetical protein FGO68_gene17568 [Halteria grandinella]
MKATLLLSIILPLASAAINTLPEFTKYTHYAYVTYNAFARGLLQEHLPTYIDSECLGSNWFPQNMSALNGFLTKVQNGSINAIEKQESYDAAEAVVNAVYYNRDKCQVGEVYEKVKNGSRCMGKGTFWVFVGCVKEESMGRGMVKIGLRIQGIAQDIIDSSGYWREADWLRHYDRVGESMGAIISYAVGFQKLPI